MSVWALGRGYGRVSAMEASNFEFVKTLPEYMKRVRSTFLSGYAGFQSGARDHVEAKHQVQCCIEVVTDFVFFSRHAAGLLSVSTSRRGPHPSAIRK